MKRQVAQMPFSSRKDICACCIFILQGDCKQDSVSDLEQVVKVSSVSQEPALCMVAQDCRRRPVAQLLIIGNVPHGHVFSRDVVVAWILWDSTTFGRQIISNRLSVSVESMM